MGFPFLEKKLLFRQSTCFWMSSILTPLFVNGRTLRISYALFMTLATKSNTEDYTTSPRLLASCKLSAKTYSNSSSSVDAVGGVGAVFLARLAVKRDDVPRGRAVQ